MLIIAFDPAEHEPPVVPVGSGFCLHLHRALQPLSVTSGGIADRG